MALTYSHRAQTSVGTCSCARQLLLCPNCRFPTARNLGHCKRRRRVFNCRNRPGAEPQVFAFSSAALVTFSGTSLEESGIVRGRCPILPGASEPGHFQDLLAEAEEDDDQDYTVSLSAESDIVVLDGSYDYYSDVEFDILPPAFAVVRTPAEFQAALRVGAFHILVKEHLDMTDSPTEPDLVGLEGLNSAVGRVLNTTRSIVVRALSQRHIDCLRLPRRHSAVEVGE